MHSAAVCTMKPTSVNQGLDLVQIGRVLHCKAIKAFEQGKGHTKRERQIASRCDLVAFATVLKRTLGSTQFSVDEFQSLLNLLLQYGQIHVIVRSLIIEKFGEETWQKIL